MEPIRKSFKAPPPADLEIHVSRAGDSRGPRLDYLLDSPSGAAGLNGLRFRGKELYQPEGFQRRLLTQLGLLNRGWDLDKTAVLRAEVADDLRSIGRDLYRSLFPEALRDRYRSIQDRVATLRIITDEPWIPWEMLHPTEPDDADADSDEAFLCIRHEMTRWFRGNLDSPCDQRIRHLLYAVPETKHKLAAGEREAESLEGLQGEVPGLRVNGRRLKEFQQFNQLLEVESFDLLHLVAHGKHDVKRPAESFIPFEDRAFRARQISAAAQRALRGRRPTIFFNTCELGQLDLSLTELDGWARRWIVECHCNAFLAPSWAVHDQPAKRFAELFYRGLADGLTLGETVRQARRTLARERPGTLDWLAYRVYGAPGARLLLGTADPTPQPVPPRSQDGPAAPSGAEPAPPGKPGDGGWGSSGSSTWGRSPEPRQEASQRKPTRTPSRQRIVLGLLVLVLSVGIALAVRLPRPSDAVGTEDQASQVDPAQPEQTERRAEDELDSLVPGREPKGLSESSSPSEATTRPTGPSVSGTELPRLPVIPGKVVLVAVDEVSEIPNRELAVAVRSALATVLDTAPIEILSPGPRETRELLNHRLILGNEQGTAWGAEYLLLVSGSSQQLPKPGVHLHATALTLSSELVRTSDGAIIRRDQQTHTGAGALPGQALTQAAERCLRAISEYLNGGSGP